MNSCSLFNGCDKDIDLIILSEDTRQWTPYSQEDGIIFQNNLDESIVRVLDYVDFVQNYERGDECAPGIEEMTLTRLVSTSFEDTISIRLTTKRVDIESVNFQSTYFLSTQTSYSSKDTNTKYQDTFFIKQKTFNEVLIYTCSTCTELSEIVFSKEIGLVAYRLNNIYWIKK